MTDQADLKTYRGNCHCKAFVFEAQFPEIKTAFRCNCSTCHKRGVLYAFPQAGTLKFVKGEEASLVTYSFGQRAYENKFCPTCGTSLLCVQKPKTEEDKPGYGVNVRSLQDLDIWGLKLEQFDGASMPPPFEPAKFTGTEPKGSVDGGKLQTGSCHCGAVRVAVNTWPLDETYDDRVVECNCSICNRYGSVWIYPKFERVSIENNDGLTYYSMGRGTWLKGFCKVCGIPVNNKGATLSDEKVAAMDEHTRKWYDNGKVIHSINSRVIDGIDLEKLKIERTDGWNKITPSYVNP